MKLTIRYLRSNEWTMGNGQCHECFGSKPRHGWWTDTVGHRKTCKLAKCLEELGEKVEWERENHSKRRLSMYSWENRLAWLITTSVASKSNDPST